LGGLIKGKPSSLAENPEMINFPSSPLQIQERLLSDEAIVRDDEDVRVSSLNKAWWKVKKWRRSISSSKDDDE